MSPLRLVLHGIDCSVLCTGRFMCYHYQTNVAVASAFASHRLLRQLYWTFHVLPLSNMNVRVTSGFASDRFLCAPYWTFHVLRHAIGWSVTCTGHFCGTAIKPECRPVHPIDCSAHCTGCAIICYQLPECRRYVWFCMA